MPAGSEEIPSSGNKGDAGRTTGIEIFPAIKPQEEDIIIKNAVSVLSIIRSGAGPADIKGVNQIDTTIISGTVTNICCESTARMLFRDFKVVFGSDVNAAVDEGAHQATLNNIETAFGLVMDADSIMAALKAGGSAKL